MNEYEMDGWDGMGWDGDVWDLGFKPLDYKIKASGYHNPN
jgi:hypothetical protein